MVHYTSSINKSVQTENNEIFGLEKIQLEKIKL